MRGQRRSLHLQRRAAGAVLLRPQGRPGQGLGLDLPLLFSGQQLAASLVPYWNKLATNKHLGGLWPNDGDGIAQSDKEHGFPPLFAKNGYTVTDPGRFDMPASNYNAQMGAFKSAGVEVIQGVLPPPEFTTFWNGCAQQGYQPKCVYVGKACEFPPAMEPLGDRAIGLTVEIWWSKDHPFNSGMTGQTSAELAAAYEAASGRQWSMPLGFRHSLMEVVFDVLKRTQNLDDKGSIRDAVKTTNYKSIVGTIDFTKGPLPNTSQTPLVIGQWAKGSKHPLEIIIEGNDTAPEIPVQGEPTLMKYA